MLTHHEEGLLLVSVILQPIESDVSDYVGGVSGNFLNAIGGVHWRVVIRALSLEYLPEVKTRGFAFQVPLPDHRGLIAPLLQQFGEGLLLAVKSLTIGELSIQVTVFSGQNHGSAWSANGIGDESAIEKHAILGNTIDVRGFITVGTISGNGLISMIIGKDEKHVLWFSMEGKAKGSQD